MVHAMLGKISQLEGHQFWDLVDLMTTVFLLYKYSECSEYLTDSFAACRDVGSLFALSRVFFDHAATLLTRNQVLKVLAADVSDSVSLWGLLATITLCKEGAQIAKDYIGELEGFCSQLVDANSPDG